MGNNGFFAGICVAAVVIPWALKSLSNGHINLNGLVVDGAETIVEIITRHDASFSKPAPAPTPEDKGL